MAGASLTWEPHAGCFSFVLLHEKTGHGVCARVRPCNTDKAEWLSSGRGSPAWRHLVKPPVPRLPSEATNGRLIIVMATSASFCDEFTGSPKGVAPGKALAAFLSLSSARTACMLKGGCLSIAPQGSYWLSSPHPLALTTASRPGIPATAETSSRAGTRGRRAERGVKARGERHARTSPSNLAPADARTRRHQRAAPDSRDKSSSGSASYRGTIPAPNAIPC